MQFSAPTRYACAFCGDSIRSGTVDITALILISRWDGPEEAQGSQQFFCHFECLAARFTPEIARELDRLRDHAQEEVE